MTLHTPSAFAVGAALVVVLSPDRAGWRPALYGAMLVVMMILDSLL